jgi:hypothetical protein
MNEWAGLGSYQINYPRIKFRAAKQYIAINSSLGTFDTPYFFPFPKV